MQTFVCHSSILKPSLWPDSSTRRPDALCRSVFLTSLPVSGVTLWLWPPPWPMKTLRIMPLRVREVSSKQSLKPHILSSYILILSATIYLNMVVENNFVGLWCTLMRKFPCLFVCCSLCVFLSSCGFRDLHIPPGGKFHCRRLWGYDIASNYYTASEKQNKNTRLLSGQLQHKQRSPTKWEW